MDVDKRANPSRVPQHHAPSASVGDSLRQRATEIIGSKTSLTLAATQAMTLPDMQQLFHELQVHQVELEMQNDELQRHQTELEMQNDELHRTQEALRRERRRYSDLFEQAPVGYCIVTEAGVLLQINLTAANLLGRPQNELVQQSITWFICYDDQDSYYLLRRQLIATGTPQSRELRMKQKDGTQFWALLQATVAKDPSDGLVHRMIVSDITVRKQAEQDFRIAATVFESTEGMIITDARQIILRVNDAFTKITGYGSADVLGRSPGLLRAGRQEQVTDAEMWLCIAQNDAWQGEIWHRRKNGEVYPARLTMTAVRNENGVVTNYVAILSDVTERKAADEKIRNLAFYDPLTQLPNRRLLMDRLALALAVCKHFQCKGALLFLDLDGFKTINDTLGHLQGDLLLELVAARLSTCVGDGDTVARLGGDEFVVMLEELSNDVPTAASEAKAIAELILTTLDHLYPLSPVPCRITCSIGITLFGIDDSETLGEPMKRADLAMYQAKAAGRNTLRFFHPQMQAVVTERMALEKDLREALKLGQFQLYYQPQMEGASHLAGVEALIRWQRPLHGLVLPAEFIPLSEETGLILALGHWVLEAACAQLVRWAPRPGFSHLTIAVNVSARQLHHSQFVPEVLRMLELTGANPNQLKLELTESLLISQVEEVIAKMGTLKERGVRFSLDDFGTGYSSLSHLKRMPLEQLKIDQGFVRDILINPNDAAISKMVIALAESIGLTVIAEGVETIAQRDFLASQGCHAYQGFLFSRPLPLDEFETFAERANLMQWPAPPKQSIRPEATPSSKSPYAVARTGPPSQT